MALFYFPGTTDQGKRIASTTQEGTFSVEVGDQVFAWRTPLGSVLPKKVCPVDGEEMSGAWTYCPLHGEKLTTQE